ncbi:DUF4124 domain-containing protein [Candidatus Colwellia aromaticivorans]|uniref:DUF4124 domain-containing protein n=1 Tax=Candidatus Colwellia aromaticivorans TaxID=2267621 RepID=UPI000DF1AF8E|nr:DUF4124 domain-containing protein [Candidatus Colwellia aromaticivorans]
MCIRSSAFVAICSAVMFSTSAIAKDIAIYRWVDENNVVHFSQQQPQDNSFSQLTTFASYKERQQPQKKQLPSVDEQLSQHEINQAEILAKNKVIAEKNCKAAQLNIKMLNSFNKITILDPDGKNRVLTDKEKKAQVTLSNKHIDLYCNNSNKQS